MMNAQNSQPGRRSNVRGSRSMNAAMANRVVMFATNETSTTNVSSSGVSAGPCSRMELRKVSMLHAQKNASPMWRSRSVFHTMRMLRRSRPTASRVLKSIPLLVNGRVTTRYRRPVLLVKKYLFIR